MLKNALAVLVSFVIGLALCEVILRVAGDELLPDPGLYELDPDVGKRLRPGWTGAEFGMWVEINDIGLRSPGATYEKRPGVFRILALGDSWTFGFRIEEPDTWPRRLEVILNERAQAQGDRTRYEVINAGVIGYSTEQEAAWLRTRGARFDPDLVVVAYYPVNDTHAKMDKYDRYNQLREIHPWLLEIYTFPRSLYLRQFIKGSRRMLKQKVARLRAGIADSLGYVDSGAQEIIEDDWTVGYRPGARGWEAARAAILEIGELCRGMSTRGLVVLLPDVGDMGRYEDRYHARVAPLVREAVDEAGLDWLDLLETFAPYRNRIEEVRLEGQRHPNPAGYNLIAETMAERIEGLP